MFVVSCLFTVAISIYETKMANPRKFSEKIALHNQKQAEETAAFEEIMREVMGATRVLVDRLSFDLLLFSGVSVITRSQIECAIFRLVFICSPML